MEKAFFGQSVSDSESRGMCALSKEEEEGAGKKFKKSTDLSDRLSCLEAGSQCFHI